MKLLRRQFLRLAAGAAALPALPRIAWRQTYLSRPVRIVVGLSILFPGEGPTIYHFITVSSNSRRRCWERFQAAIRRIEPQPMTLPRNTDAIVQSSLYTSA